MSLRRLAIEVLPREFEAELDDPAVARVGDSSESPAGERSHRIGKVYLVEGIQQFCSEFEPVTFLDSNIFQDSQVRRNICRTRKDAPSGRPYTAYGRRPESTRIEELRNHLSPGRVTPPWVANYVGAGGPPRHAVQLSVLPGIKSKCSATVRCSDAGNAPTTEDSAQNTPLRFVNRWAPNTGEDEDVARIPIGPAVVVFRVIGVGEVGAQRVPIGVVLQRLRQHVGGIELETS